MKNTNYFFSFFLLGLLLFTNCLSKKVKNIKEFCENIENNISADTLDLLKSCQLDSAGSCLALIGNHLDKEYYMLENNSIIIQNLDSVEQVSDSMKIVILKIQFYYYVRGNVADLQDIRKQLRKMHEYSTHPNN